MEKEIKYSNGPKCLDRVFYIIEAMIIAFSGIDFYFKEENILEIYEGYGCPWYMLHFITAFVLALSVMKGNWKNRILDVCDRIAVVISFFLSIACTVFSLRMTFSYMESPSNIFESMQQIYWKFHLVLHLCVNIFFHLILIYKSFRKTKTHYYQYINIRARYFILGGVMFIPSTMFWLVLERPYIFFVDQVLLQNFIFLSGLFAALVAEWSSEWPSRWRELEKQPGFNNDAMQKLYDYVIPMIHFYPFILSYVAEFKALFKGPVEFIGNEKILSRYLGFTMYITIVHEIYLKLKLASKERISDQITPIFTIVSDNSLIANANIKIASSIPTKSMKL